MQYEHVKGSGLGQQAGSSAQGHHLYTKEPCIPPSVRRTVLPMGLTVAIIIIITRCLLAIGIVAQSRARSVSGLGPWHAGFRQSTTLNSMLYTPYGVRGSMIGRPGLVA